MGLYYHHQLIPTKPDFFPSAVAIAAFLEELIQLGVVGDDPKLSGWSLKSVAPKLYRARNPSTGKILEVFGPSKLPDRRFSLENIQSVPGQVGDAIEFDVLISGVGIPRLPPLPVHFDEPYGVEVWCHMRAAPMSMSCVPDQPAPEHNQMLHDAQQQLTQIAGRFVNPHNGTIVEVPNSGFARFWMSFGLGKFLLPNISNNDLQILNPQIVGLAAKCFQVEFAQGCQYG